MEKHIAQDCQSVDNNAKQEMSQLLMTKKLQVIPCCHSCHSVLSTSHAPCTERLEGWPQS